MTILRRSPTFSTPPLALQSTRVSARGQRGITLVEVVISMAIGALLIGGLLNVIVGAFAMHDHAQSRNETVEQARYALERMTRAVADSHRLMVPMPDNPLTAQDESVRNPGVLGVTLDPTLDRDRNAVVDADNDGDGRIDEDLAKDANNDQAAGIVGIDDNNNGVADTDANDGDDDEDGNVDEDALNAADVDGDAAKDEDPGEDMNADGAPGVVAFDDDGDGSIDEGDTTDDDEDGSKDEDWWDTVLFHVVGADLVERVPLPYDANGDTSVDGLDFVERVIARQVSAFTVARVQAANGGPPLLQLQLDITMADGEVIGLSRTVRMGAGW